MYISRILFQTALNDLRTFMNQVRKEAVMVYLKALLTFA